MKRLLVVDDDLDILELMQELLSDQYDVVTASDGRAAMALIAREEIDAIVLDLMMPLMSGQEVMEELRKMPDAPPVVLLSATRDLAERARTLGAAEHCTKPCSPEKLIAAVERAINGAGDSGGGNHGPSNRGTSSGPASPPSPSAPPKSIGSQMRALLQDGQHQ